MSKFKIGDQVTSTKPKEAYYSDFNGNPKVVIQPGHVGTVGAVDCPYVVHKPGRRSAVFNCVDFTVEGVYSGDPKHGNNTWRCSFPEKELKHVTASEDADEGVGHVEDLAESEA